MSNGVSRTSSAVTLPDSSRRNQLRLQTHRLEVHGMVPAAGSVGPVAVAFDRQGEQPDDALGMAGHRHRGQSGGRVALMSASTSTLEPSWSSTLLAFGLASRCRLALETGDGDTLLGHGVGDVLGVLPESELDHAHDEQQQQRGSDDQFGCHCAALVSEPSAPECRRSALGQVSPGTCGGATTLVGSPTAAGGDVVGRRDDLGHDDPDRGERQCDEQGGHDDGLGGVAGLGIGPQLLPPDGEGVEKAVG